MRWKGQIQLAASGDVKSNSVGLTYFMVKKEHCIVQESAISYRSWRAKTFEEVVVRRARGCTSPDLPGPSDAGCLHAIHAIPERDVKSSA